MVRVEEGRGGHLANLDGPAASLKHLERVVLDTSTYFGKNLRIHALWPVLRAVKKVIDARVWHPFFDELRVLHHAPTARDGAVIDIALDALEAGNVADVEIKPLADLASWFTTSVALVPDEGAGMFATCYFACVVNVPLPPPGSRCW